MFGVVGQATNNGGGEEKDYKDKYATVVRSL